MRIQEQTIDDGMVWHLCGPLTADSRDLLERAVGAAALDGRHRIVMDLSDVSMIDAGGLGSLVTVCRASMANSMTLRLARVPKRVGHVLAITRLTNVLAIFDSVEEALGTTCSSAYAVTSLPPSSRVQPTRTGEAGDLFFVGMAETGGPHAGN